MFPSTEIGQFVCRYVPVYRYGTQWESVVIHTIFSSHVETVVLLSQQKADDYVKVELELDERDVTSAESKATYKKIKDYVLK